MSSKKIFDQLKALADEAAQMDAERRMAHFQSLIERNKTRRGRGSPPAALPVQTGRPKDGGHGGGAAALATNKPDARDFV